MTLSIFICEDNKIQRAHMEAIVNKYLMSDDFDMSLALSTSTPAALLAHIDTNATKSGLYLLDVDLQSDINGIELAAKIKKIDVSATIVFVTTHSEMVQLAFKLKVEAMDYILKDYPPDKIEQRVIECMQMAHQRFVDGKHTKEKLYTVKIGGQRIKIPYDEILFFESSINQRNKIFLHRLNGSLEFYSTIYDVSNLGMPFINCHQSFVININHAKSIDTSNREIVMVDDTIVPVSKRRMAAVLGYFE